MAAPAAPCAPVTLVRCDNTPPAVEANNAQLPPFAAWDAAVGATDGAVRPPPPAGRPLRSQIVVKDDVAIAFQTATLTSAGANATDGGAERALVFSFTLSRPGLVRYAVVRDVVVTLARGVLPVFEARREHRVAVSRECGGALLAPGTAYGLWFNATDAYGATTQLRMLSQTL